MPSQRKRKPVAKKMWQLLRRLPKPLRKRLIRSRFQICYELDRDYVFKIAETEGEIEAALKIVYEAYAHLGYVDERAERLHCNAHLCLPSTTILVIKYRNEVVGTMSIIPDSKLGLPSEATWCLDFLKSVSPRIAEVSALAIKRSHKAHRGQLLLTLCKFMFEVGTKILDLDGVVMAATEEVEPFYTDLLLFKKVVAKTGQRHEPVKGNRSTCCFLDFNKVRPQYIREYAHRPTEKNLFYFFTEFNSPNLRIPLVRRGNLDFLIRKNESMARIVSKIPDLKAELRDGPSASLA